MNWKVKQVMCDFPLKISKPRILFILCNFAYCFCRLPLTTVSQQTGENLGTHQKKIQLDPLILQNGFSGYALLVGPNNTYNKKATL